MLKYKLNVYKQIKIFNLIKSLQIFLIKTILLKL